MKKIFLSLVLLLFVSNYAFADESMVETYSVKNKFGLIKNGVKITDAKYTKLIRLKDTSWLFLYRNKYGIMSNDGTILVEPKYTRAERFAGKFAKLGSNGKYALFDENGQMIINQEYQTIDLLYGRMFLVQKKFKYGLIGFDGDIILAPIADDIYMPDYNVLKISYDGNWYEIKSKNKEALELPTDIAQIGTNNSFNITQLIQNPITSTSLGVISASDYFIKIFSSLSPAYENTIDELILDHGADTASILIKSSWLIKFPFVYTKNYFNNFIAPNNGPLSDVKTNLKNKLNE